MYGVIIAFKNFRIADGILGSNWNNFEHFRLLLFESYTFKRVFFNTLEISLLRLIVGFPAPIILALLLNEVINTRFKRIVQSITYLPHFISWVILAGIVHEILSPQRGIANYLITLFGGEPIHFLASKTWFVPVLVVTNIWKNVGWGSIIYLAALSSVDPSLYEAAEIDGAHRLQKAWHISIPAIASVIVILLILRLGRIMNAGFDQIFNLYNPLVYEVSDIIDTFVYRVGLIDARYDFSAAVGLFKNVIGVFLLLGTNAVVRRFSEYAVW